MTCIDCGTRCQGQRCSSCETVKQMEESHERRDLYEDVDEEEDE